MANVFQKIGKKHTQNDVFNGLFPLFFERNLKKITPNMRMPRNPQFVLFIERASRACITHQQTYVTCDGTQPQVVFEWKRGLLKILLFWPKIESREQRSGKFPPGEFYHHMLL